MKIKRINISKSTLLLSVVTAGLFSTPVFSECINTELPYQQADVILNIDANNVCDDVKDQYGCNIKNGVGSCDFSMNGVGFTATSWINQDDTDDIPDGSLQWEVKEYNSLTLAKADTVIFGGGSKGKNNCGMIYHSDVESGYGGDCTQYDDAGNCVTFQNFTGLSVCSNLKTDEPPPEEPVAVTLKACQTQQQTDLASFASLGELDQTGIQCPVYEEGDDIPLGKQVGDQKPVVVCNLEKDKYAWGTVGANEDGSVEEVCCQCGIAMDIEQTCFVSDDPDKNAANGCADNLISDPTQDVNLYFNRSNGDPCTKIVSGGKVYKTCW